MLSRLIAFVRGIARRGSAAAEADAELQFHLEQEIEAHIARGLPPAEARRIALRDLGGVAQTLETVRDVRTLWVDALWQDLRDVARRLRREPWFAAVAIGTLTLAVGANTAILSVADAVLFRPLPYADPDRVFVIQMMNRLTGAKGTMIPYSFIEAIGDLHGDVSAVGMMESSNFGSGPRVVVSTPDGPLTLSTAEVSSGYYQSLGVTPARGRLFGAQDEGRTGRAALLSYSAWLQRFGGDEAIVGRAVAIGDSSFDVIGVLPQAFVYPSNFAGRPEVVTEMKPPLHGAVGGAFNPIVRIAAGASREQAQAAIEAATASIAGADPNWKNQAPMLSDVRTVLYELAGAPVMRFLLASAALILLIGCANLANLLVVRGHRHTRDTAMRLALGASRARLVRPIILEALFIGAASATVAVAATRWLFELLLRQVPPMAYRGAPVGVSARVAAMSLGISVTGALVFAALPAWRAAHLNALELIQRGGVSGRRRTWLGPMVVAQVGLSVVAVFGAIVAARAFTSALNTPLGFSSNDVINIDVRPPQRLGTFAPRVAAVSPDLIEVTNPPPPPEDASSFYARVLDALKARPEVISAGASSGLPFGGTTAMGFARLLGSETRVGVGVEYVMPGFFETIGISVLRGRLPTWDDFGRDRNQAVVSDAAARALFPGVDPVGQVFRDGGTEHQFRVIGVVADARQSLDARDLPRAYVLLPAATRGILTPVVRVHDRSNAVLSDLKTAVHAAAPDSLVSAEWWSDAISGVSAYRNPRFQTIVLGTFATLALILTTLGIFSVVNYLVVSRTREMGVRLAIGAAPGGLVLFVLRRAIAPVLVGIGAGLLAVRLMRPLAEAQLFKVDTHDPRTLAVSAGVVVVAALAAAYLPARRAARVDPVAALKSD